MSKTTEFGVRLPVAGPLADPFAAKEMAVLSENLEYDAVWVHDFIAWTTYQNEHHVSCGSVEALERMSRLLLMLLRVVALLVMQRSAPFQYRMWV